MLAPSKTATPTLFVDTINPGCNYIAGWVGTILDKEVVLEAGTRTKDRYDLPNASNIPIHTYIKQTTVLPIGTRVPEVNAYVYLFLNGLLANPPRLGAGTGNDGGYLNTDTKILTDSQGFWATSQFYIDYLAPVSSGQTIVAKAKAPLKQISDRCIPYRAGGSPTPVGLGVLDNYGAVRAPQEGESSIYGRMSYWTCSNPYAKAPLKIGDPIFGCNTDVYIYIDGVRAGQVLKNNIVGVNATWPTLVNFEDYVFQLMIDDHAVNIPLGVIDPSDVTFLTRAVNIDTLIYEIEVPAPRAGLRIFRNGLRQIEGVDVTVNINSTTRLASIVFLTDINLDTDTLLAVVQYEIQNIVMGENLVTVSDPVNGSNTVFHTLSPIKFDTAQIFKNGARQNSFGNVDFTVTAPNIITFTSPPEVGSTIIADYQPLAAPLTLYYTRPVSGVKDSINQRFYYQSLTIRGNPHVYRNGLLQSHGIDYTLDVGNAIIFRPWIVIKPTDSITVDFAVSPLSLESMITYLNSLNEFKTYCLTASKITQPTQAPVVVLQGALNYQNKDFVIPPSVVPINVRIYLDGLRQKSGIDYTINYPTGRISFLIPPTPFNVVTASIQLSQANVIFDSPFTLTGRTITTPYTLLVSSVQLYKNGLRLTNVANSDYVVSGSSITLIDVPSSIDSFVIDYQTAGTGAQLLWAEIPTGSIDGINDTFTFTVPPGGRQPGVYVNGLRYFEAVDYNIVNTQVIFNSGRVPQPNDSVLVDFDIATLIAGVLNEQLNIATRYRLDWGRASDQAKDALFGTDSFLNPGKDDSGEFKHYFNAITSEWRYTHSTEFTRLWHISARAFNHRRVIISPC